MIKNLPYGLHSIDQKDIDSVIKVLKSNSLSGGKIIQDFEKTFSNYLAVKETVVCNNGTSALYLASKVIGISPEDLVVVPSTTFTATASAPRLLGAEVIFSDVDPENGLMTLETVKEVVKKSKREIKAIFPVHLNGLSADMPKIYEFAVDKGIKIIDDASHALGTSFLSEKIGNGKFSDMTTFSMHPVKSITMGEGGFITTSSLNYARELRRYRNHGIVSDKNLFIDGAHGIDEKGEKKPWYYEISAISLNFRASEINCALGLSQLLKLEKFVKRREEIANYYEKLLMPLKPILKPIKKVKDCKSSWHLYPVLIDFERMDVNKERFMKQLRKSGINTQVHYIPLHMQPYWRKNNLNLDLNFQGAIKYYEKCLSLPIYPSLLNEDIEFIVKEISKLINS